MARIVLGSYLVQFPMGGYFSWILQWLIGFHRLGHDVYFVERSNCPDACFDPEKNEMTDDCTYGTTALDEQMARFGLRDRWCFRDYKRVYHGLSRERIEEVFRTADAFVDMGTHGGWQAEASRSRVRVLIDGEPASTQMRMVQREAEGEALPSYDYYYTVGQNIGTPHSSAPTVNRRWRRILFPVVMDLVPARAPVAGAPFTTVMSWQAHGAVTFGGVTYGQKDLEFVKFMDLPRRTSVPLEIAVTGKDVPAERLREVGWRVRPAHDVSRTLDSYWEYIAASRGEFSVCKNVFVATRSGWFGDRASAYLASGRPVVMQDTGFGTQLPCGRGLFAVRTADEAAAAIDLIESDYERHSRWARDIAMEFLDTTTVLRKLLHEIGA